MLDKGKKSFRPVLAWSVGIYLDYVSLFSCFSCLFRLFIIILLVATFHRVCSVLWVCFLDGQTVSNRFAAVFKLFIRFCRGFRPRVLGRLNACIFRGLYGKLPSYLSHNR